MGGWCSTYLLETDFCIYTNFKCPSPDGIKKSRLGGTFVFEDLQSDAGDYSQETAQKFGFG
jgi:hypothetical protein